MTETVGAATRVSGINRRTTCEQRNSWRWPAVVPQRAEHGAGVVPIAALAESAGAIAAQVIAMRGDGTATFLPELFARMLFCSVAVPPFLKIPPAEFPLTVLLFIAKLPEPLTMAPPVPPHTPEQR